MSASDDFDYRTPASDDPLLLRRNLLRQGTSDAEIRRELRDGSIGRVWWGGYTAPDTTSDDDVDDHTRRDERYRLMIRAAVRVGGPRRYLSQQSAATVLDIPLLHKDTTTVHVTSERVGRASRGLVIHQARVPDSDFVEIDGVTVTSIGRTVCVLARSGTFREAVCALDSDLFQARIRKQPFEVMPIVDAMRRRHGIAMLRTALPLTSDQSESIGESVSKCVIVEAGSIPVPERQPEVVVGRRKEKWGKKTLPPLSVETNRIRPTRPPTVSG
ncbi:hypothetical protein ABLE94_23935 [Gordonia sp. VNK1]|uniref:hypothetical protein n=1 Tax=Gordonia oleivorans TaxID=3156618 RepID=UPI0032B3ED9D